MPHASTSSGPKATAPPQAGVGHKTVSGVIAERIAAGELRADPAQTKSIRALDTLLVALSAPALGNKKSALGWLFGKKPVVAAKGPRGLYLWGGVGRGKSMLMDLFYDLAPTKPKRRVHFHAFMQEVHSRVHTWRKEQEGSKNRSADPIPPLAEALSQEVHLLCFDEFAVTDVADAMILARLFTGLFERGVTVVATSNVQPDLLYKDGLNRSFFLPFIALVKERMEVLELVSDTDHRMENLTSNHMYMVGDDAAQRFDARWNALTDNFPIEPGVVEVGGRSLAFDHICGGLLRTNFANLCEKPLGAADYLALCARFHTICVENIPVMHHEDRNAAKRFITLIDTFYDQGIILVASAAAPPAQLYTPDHGTEAFEFERTISRLREMQSEQWPSSHMAG